MTTAARARFSCALVLLTFTGAWLGHTLEMLRLHGTAALEAALRGPVHGYMAPVGLVLAVTGLVAALRLVWLWHRLCSSLDAAIAAARRLLGRGPAPAHTGAAPRRPPSTGAGLLLLWIPLGALQLVVYTLQENLEAHRAGLTVPGLSVLTGTHWAAPILHLYVAFVLAAAALLVQRLLAHRARRLDAANALVRLLVALLRRGLRALPAPPDEAPRPRRRLAHPLWGRPPPLRLRSVTAAS